MGDPPCDHQPMHPVETVSDGLPAHDQPAEEPPVEDGFATLGLDERLLKTVAGLGYEEPTPIQLAAVPPLLDGRDLLAEAPTGTGKTAAFALPMLHRLAGSVAADPARRKKGGAPLALVLAPTRELAMQTAEAIHRYGRELGVRVLPVYGGQPIGTQLRALQRGVDIVVATPGRAVDHLTRGSVRFDSVQTVVLDEADEMLDMGFAEDLEAILGGLPETRQTALFSATLPRPVKRLAERHLKDPVRIAVHAEREPAGEAARVRQVAYVVRRADKLVGLCRLLDMEDPTSALVFARTRGEVDDLAEALSGRGHDAAALHGGLAQEQRDRIMGRFREGALDVLVATDVAARGLDIEHVSHVVNFDVPSSPEVYVHRIGRTGRAGREGTAITLVEPREHRLLRDIEAAMGAKLEVGRLPTVASLRERRLDMLRSTLRETVLGDDLDRYRAVVEPLSDEFDLVDIALAAVRLADGPDDEADDEELATPTLPPDRAAPAGRGRGGPRGAPGAGRDGPKAAWSDRSGGPPANRRDAKTGPTGARGRRLADQEPTTRLFVGAGRAAGMRPSDLVGAIANEAGLAGDRIGSIQIAEGFSLVEVPEAEADRVIAALRRGSIKGRQINVRRERY
jgi:ATP-dependent RNA helicase DeaD